MSQASADGGRFAAGKSLAAAEQEEEEQETVEEEQEGKMVAVEESDAAIDTGVDVALAARESGVADRLAASDAARKADIHRRREALSASSAPSEDASRFWQRFRSREEAVRDSFASVSVDAETEVERRRRVDEVATQVAELEREVADAAYYLPAYDVRTCQAAITALRETIASLRAEAAPKRKFAFAGKSKKSPSSSSTTQQAAHNNNNNNNNNDNDNSNGASTTQLESAATSCSYLSDGCSIRNETNITIVKNRSEIQGQDLTLSNLTDCTVYVCGQLAALFINKLTNCRVYCGPVSGAVLIEDVTDSVLVLASHQIRIHNTSWSDFYLRVRSRPIVEHTCAVRFAPYVYQYEGVESDLAAAQLDGENELWQQVDDFRWLRAMQSPNWEVLPEEERLQTVFAKQH
eukprot:jgi/Chlat1/8204/Chrsp76S07641